MSHLRRPRHPVVERALRLSRHYCAGNIIDDAPAFAHACKVAVMLARYVPDATPEMIAAALLHDAPEFVSPSVNLDNVLKHAIGDGVAPLVNAIHTEHAAMMSGAAPRVPGQPVTQIMAADKVVAFSALVRRAGRAPDECEFWAKRTALQSLFPWFEQWCEMAAPQLPESLHTAVSLALARLETAAVARPQPASPTPGGSNVTPLPAPG
ncbi:HD domain-containing protein [Hamadaea sp. NPDC051192]|uniref:HD domain-containing protein n=1 Tax=Hamadaea sp. NPDC051192 TaxID=3154940 RepID=UPI0034433772